MLFQRNAATLLNEPSLTFSYFILLYRTVTLVNSPPQTLELPEVNVLSLPIEVTSVSFLGFLHTSLGILTHYTALS